MGSLFATVLRTVPLIAPLRGTFLLDDPQLGWRDSPTRRGSFPEIPFSSNRHAPVFPSGCPAVDEVS